MTEPEQWARDLLEAVHDASDMGSACGMVDCPQCKAAALTIQRAFEERTGQLIPAPSVDDARITALEASLAEARRQALEEAAKVAENFDMGSDSSDDAQAARIAFAIRELKDSHPTPDGV